MRTKNLKIERNRFLKIFLKTAVFIAVIALIFASAKIDVFKTKAAGDIISKTDGKDEISLPKDSALDNTYNITYKANLEASDFFYATGRRDRSCNEGWGSTHRWDFSTNRWSSGGYGGNDITTDGNYLYVTDDAMGIVKLDSNLNFIKEYRSCGNPAGNSIVTDGEYLYISDVDGKWLSKWTNGAGESDFSEIDTITISPGTIFQLTFDGTYLYALIFAADNINWGIRKFDKDLILINQLLLPYSQFGTIAGVSLASDKDFLYTTWWNKANDTLVICKWTNDNYSKDFCSSSLYGFIGEFATGIGHEDKTDYLYVVAQDNIRKYDLLTLNQVDSFPFPGLVSGVGSIGSYKIVDELPQLVEYVSSNEGGVYNLTKHSVKWNVSPTGSSQGTVTVTGKIGQNLCDKNISNTALLYAGVLEIDRALDTTEILCSLTSQMVKVIVEWQEGARTEKVELKTILKDVR